MLTSIQYKSNEENSCPDCGLPHPLEHAECAEAGSLPRGKGLIYSALALFGAVGVVAVAGLLLVNASFWGTAAIYLKKAFSW